MFSTTTSAVFASSSNIARPRGDFRFSVTPFLHEFSSRKNHASSPRLSESAVRPGSPVGGSILMTSAPSHASIWVQDGPASYWVRSRTRIPASAFGIAVSLLLDLQRITPPFHARPVGRPVHLHHAGPVRGAGVDRRGEALALVALPSRFRDPGLVEDPAFRLGHRHAPRAERQQRQTDHRLEHIANRM